ncbi:alcohol dehydrogenase catalytic domain-containing protein [Bifidobacterium sp.]|uniref:alcohol dehydrogenase catalytic domain-containing protein n=1 Tax=Bifidobacterium sp. TaxID=41200 RepID=UPI003D7C9142
MAESMMAAVLRKPGGPEALELTAVPKPHAKPGWSVVKVKGFGINHSEIFTRQGLSPSVQLPRIPGIECVGLVEQTSDEERLPMGQTVVSMMGGIGREFDGGYAQYALLPNAQIHPVRTDLFWADLAAVPETYYTAYQSMLTLDIQAGDVVLVRAGASGVGVAFCRLVKARFPDSRLVASTRHMDKAGRLMSVGFDRVIHDEDGHLDIGADERFDKVLELVGPATLRDSIAHTRQTGTVCSTGQLGGQWTLDDFDPIMDLRRQVRLTGCYSGDVDGKSVQDMFSYIERWQVPVAPERVFNLAHIQQAHEYVEHEQGFGKAVVLTNISDKGAAS